MEAVREDAEDMKATEEIDQHEARAEKRHVGERTPGLALGGLMTKQNAQPREREKSEAREREGQARGVSGEAEEEALTSR